VVILNVIINPDTVGREIGDIFLIRNIKIKKNYSFKSEEYAIAFVITTRR